jgi:cytochrome oxidase Cu insertion factor (SCO1/SenC/PrrC family)
MDRRSVVQKGAAWAALAVFGGWCAWALAGRPDVVAACLSTIRGVTSRVAHVNTPFGVGSAVESGNPVLGVVPDFALTERSGATVRRSDLLGDYWVASFIFTRCATSCPMAVNQLASLQSDLPREIRLVSFSVDPEYDSPQVLADFAEKNGADVRRWLFLTGDKTSIYRAVREGFHLAVEENENATPALAVTHTPRFALVDPKGRIRGYYDSSDPGDLGRLRADVKRLLAPGPVSG